MGSIMVTGGTGYIGSHTCFTLLERGYDIFVIDSLINSSKKSLENILKILNSKNNKRKRTIFFRKGDIRDKEFLHKIFYEAKGLNKDIQAVIHFAGLKSVSESFKNSSEYWDVNVNGSRTLIEVMNYHKCYSIVFSSSASIYDISDGSKVHENTPLNPKSPYGKTKLEVEKILNDLYCNSSNNWKIANLRYFNPIGAHNSGNLGEDPKSYSNNLFPKLMQAALKQENKLIIYGKDWDTKDGSAVRDYIHVMDVAYGHLLVLNYLMCRRRINLNLNLGTGKGISVLELIKKFEIFNNVKIQYQFSQRRLGDVASLVADNAKAKLILDWEPKRNIDDMCKDGWKWKIKNPNGYGKFKQS